MWHNSLPAHLPADSEKSSEYNPWQVFTEYREVLSELHCPRLDERCDASCERTIKKTTDGNRLSHLLPQTKENVNYNNLYVILTTGRRSNVKLTVLRKAFTALPYLY